MYNNTRNILVGALVLALSLGILCTNASDSNNSDSVKNTETSNTSTSGSFSIKEAKVLNGNTLSVSFSKDLLEDTSMFEFSLTPKADESKEIPLTGISLSSSNELKVNITEPLKTNEEYNLVVVFASDKEGNVIENGVDGMVTFKTPEVFPSEEAGTNGELNAAGADDTLNVASESSSGTAQPLEATAGDTKSLPQTGPKEMMFVILAMILGLGVMYVRKKA